MTLAEVLQSLFPQGHDVQVEAGGLILGSGRLSSAMTIEVIGTADGTPLGIEGALQLAERVLTIVDRGRKGPILVLVDSGSQLMSKREELLGLNEYLAHLAKCLILADLQGWPTVGLLYGHTAAGAFIATALATRALVALPGAAPEVMDLPSISRVTKLPLKMLEEMAQSTPVFAPGLDNLAQTGAVLETWDPARSLEDQLETLLARLDDGHDRRDALGRDRKGRPKAAGIASRVQALAASALAAAGHG